MVLKSAYFKIIITLTLLTIGTALLCGVLTSNLLSTRSADEQLLASIQNITVCGIVLGIVSSALAGFLLTHMLLRPLSKLTPYAESLAQGNFEERRIEIRTHGEIGDFARRFNNMVAVMIKSLSEMSSEKNKVEEVLRYMTDGVIAFYIDGGIMHINPAAKRMLHIEDESSVSFDEFFKQNDVNICLAELVYLDYISTVEREMVTDDRIFRVFFAQLSTEQSRAGGVVSVFQDVTEVEKMETLRREFIANVSHELRTPLTTVKSYAETLLDELSDEPEVSKRFLEIINSEVDRMTRMVRDLLTLTTLDVVVIEQTKQYFDLDELIKAVVSRMSIESASNSQTLTYERSTALPLIYADRDRIEQVILNIISNALKYTRDDGNGRIEVYAGHIYNEVYIKIKDNGIGIANKDLPRIFERFYRVDKARSRDKGGTGLGLAIAQEIVRLHGGEIDISSKFNAGTEVIIKLPISEAQT